MPVFFENRHYHHHARQKADSVPVNELGRGFLLFEDSRREEDSRTKQGRHGTIYDLEGDQPEDYSEQRDCENFLHIIGELYRYREVIYFRYP